MDTVDRNYVESLIDKAGREAATAFAMATAFEQDAVAEHLMSALHFIRVAREKLTAGARNPNGTTGPQHITDEGIELEPPTR